MNRKERKENQREGRQDRPSLGALCEPFFANFAV
jgi:hypothetical protein